MEVVSWSAREVAGFLRALGLSEWTEAFLTHRIQGDTMFSVTEPTLAEMGVSKIGDRLYLVDCLQSLYEELTAWKSSREKKMQAARTQAVPALPGGGSSGGGQPARKLKRMHKRRLMPKQQAQAQALRQAAGSGAGLRQAAGDASGSAAAAGTARTAATAASDGGRCWRCWRHLEGRTAAVGCSRLLSGRGDGTCSPARRSLMRMESGKLKVEKVVE